MLQSIILGLALSGQIAPAQSNAPPLAAPHEPRKISDIRKDISALLIAESNTKDLSARAVYARKLVALHREIVRDPRFIEDELLQGQRIKVWTRLSQIRDEAKRRISIEARRAKSAALIEQAELEKQLAFHCEYADRTWGGPAALLARGGGAVAADFGPELVELIQNTINPASWDVNGGNSTIFYYRPVFALVVRAPAEAHSEIGGLLGGLRAAGE